MKFLIAVFLPASLFSSTFPFIAPSPFILVEIYQPPRLFRPPLLFETPEYSEIKCIRWIQKQVVVTLRYIKRESIVFFTAFKQRFHSAYILIFICLVV